VGFDAPVIEGYLRGIVRGGCRREDGSSGSGRHRL